MDLEKDYIEYVGEFSLAILAISAVYFFDPFRPVTYLTLLLTPTLFGYTAYISREGFVKSSFLAMIVLLFSPINYIMAGVAIVIATGNILVSVFAGGDRFRDYYSSTTIPLIIIGLLMGTAVFYAASNNAEVAESIRSTAGETLGSSAESVIENAGLIENQKEQQKVLVEQVSSETVSATKLYVRNNTDIQPQARQEVVNTLEKAEDDIPQKLSEKADENMNETQVDIEQITSDMVESNLKGKAMIVFLPITLMFFYSLQPLVGLLTAVFASAFSLAARFGE